MKWTHQYSVIASLLLLAVAGYFAIFNRLDVQPMQLWDESSYALNAQEMLERKDPFGMYLLGQPELYNTKPPFAIWCMAISLKTIGFNELGARLPAAMFALFSTLLLFYVTYRFCKNVWYALFPSLILLSSAGFMGEHIARTGDTDSILAFWILAQCVAVFLYTSSQENNRKFLWIAAVCMTMGCFTKGIAGLTAMPGIVAWLLYTKRFGAIFKQKEFYIGIGIFIFIVPGYYLLRNHLTPGYLETVYNFELGGRLWQQEFLNPEYRPFYYYYQSMITNERLVTWIFVLPLAIFIVIRSKQSSLGQLGLMFLFALISVSLVLGSSSTKLFWYDAPLYPLIAGVIGVSVFLLIERTQTYQVALFFIACLSWPYYKVVSSHVYQPLSSHFPSFLKEVRAKGYVKDSIYVINADANFSLYFYAKKEVLNGRFMAITGPNDSTLTKGMLIVTEKYAREVDVNKIFILDTLERMNECNLYRIQGLRGEQQNND